MKRRTIRGCSNSIIYVVRSNDPLDGPLGLKPRDYVFVTSESCATYGVGTREGVTTQLTLAATRRLHRALGEMLRGAKK